jgi:predicted SnoaL-like aldol condensation-catalyzing enzyme
LQAQDYPEFEAWVARSVEPQSRLVASGLLKSAEAFANLDASLLDSVLAQDFQQHDPMLAPGREGLLALASAAGRPRGGAPNLLEDTAVMLFEPPWLLIHRGGRLGPLRSQNFDLLQFSDSGQWLAYFSYKQPLEAGWLDNLLFSFVVPRQLDLIPSVAREPLPLWLGRSEYTAPFQTTITETNLNRELVRNYLDSLHLGFEDKGFEDKGFEGKGSQDNGQQGNNEQGNISQDNGARTRALVERYLAPGFQLHLPGMPAGREAFARILERAQRRPGAVKVQLMLAQHDLVWVLSRVQEIREADIPVVAAADLFRVRNGLIVEQWKVVQPVPRFANNKNGLCPRPIAGETD